MKWVDVLGVYMLVALEIAFPLESSVTNVAKMQAGVGEVVDFVVQIELLLVFVVVATLHAAVARPQLLLALLRLLRPRGPLVAVATDVGVPIGEDAVDGLQVALEGGGMLGGVVRADGALERHFGVSSFDVHL